MKTILKSGVLILFCAVLGIISCEDLDLEGEEAGNVQGLWELNRTTGSNTYLSISDTEVVFYYYNAIEGCITTDAYEVLRIDGTGFYILAQDGLDENRVLAISKNGERIHVRDIEETQSELDKFWPSNIDIETLAPICVDPKEVYGDWELTESDGHTVHLTITKDSIKVINKEPQKECYFISTMEIINIDGNIFTLDDNDPNASSSTQQVKITRIAEGIEIERSENGELIVETFIESDADFTTFEPECKFDPIEGILGKWQYEDNQSETDVWFYLTISLENFSFHYLIGDPINDPDNVCFIIDAYEVVSIEDGSITIRNSIEPFEIITLLIQYNESEGLLYLNSLENALTFFRTDIDDAYINNNCQDNSIPVNKIF